MNQKTKVRIFTWLLASSFLAFSLNACTKKQVKKTSPDEQTEEAALSEDEMNAQELDIHGKDFVAASNLGVVYFEYDSSELSDDARQTLSKNADYLKKNVNLEVLSEGHTDERGTVGYNLALGQKRAAAVRKYYVSLGLQPKRVGSLSYGKEKPTCSEATEECWTQNRRVETKVRAIKVSNGKTNHSDEQ